MGWVWVDDESRSSAGDGDEKNTTVGFSINEGCSTRTVVRSQCRTEEVEPGKFLRKCEKTEEILRNCVGKPVEVIKLDKEYTEDDVTDLVVSGGQKLKSEGGPFEFSGLRSDIEDIEHHLQRSFNHLRGLAEEMKRSVFDVFGDFYDTNPSSSGPSCSTRREIPIEDSHKPRGRDSGGVDLTGLGRDV
ncbi:hypothetical protein K2173_005693 [Erythroxylum novogranatense]|uniref:Uncharacterized protein n=1 Tax=Erythroxylum novogranatense TaxID=1862640 RepID=A0AAV8SQI4_9ROSI|nr:hypothetical protein K2173_005693 [Erythroxylum novogranatense]